MTADTSTSQLSCSFECGLRRTPGDVCTLAAKLGWLDVLQCPRAEHCPGTLVASEQGHIEVLRWTQAAGCPVTWQTCRAAEAGGHLDVLKTARASGSPGNGTTCSAATSRGHLGILQFFPSEGCPWDSRKTRRAFQEATAMR